MNFLQVLEISLQLDNSEVIFHFFLLLFVKFLFDHGLNQQQIPLAKEVLTEV